MPSGVVIPELDAAYDTLEVVSAGNTYAASSGPEDDIDWKKQETHCRGWPPPLYE